MFLQANMEIPENLKDTLDTSQELTVAKPKALSASDLHQAIKTRKCQHIATHSPRYKTS